jgi:ribosomal protein L37E
MDVERLEVCDNLLEDFAVVCRSCGVHYADKIRIELSIQSTQLNRLVYETRPVITITCNRCGKVVTNEAKL